MHCVPARTEFLLNNIHVPVPGLREIAELRRPPPSTASTWTNQIWQRDRHLMQACATDPTLEHRSWEIVASAPTQPLLVTAAAGFDWLVTTPTCTPARSRDLLSVTLPACRVCVPMCAGAPRAGAGRGRRATSRRKAAVDGFRRRFRSKVLRLVPRRLLRRPSLRQHDARLLPAQLPARRCEAVATCSHSGCCGRRFARARAARPRQIGRSAGRLCEQLRGRRRPRLVQALWRAARRVKGLHRRI